MSASWPSHRTRKGLLVLGVCLLATLAWLVLPSNQSVWALGVLLLGLPAVLLVRPPPGTSPTLERIYAEQVAARMGHPWWARQDTPGVLVRLSPTVLLCVGASQLPAGGTQLALGVVSMLLLFLAEGLAARVRDDSIFVAVLAYAHLPLISAISLSDTPSTTAAMIGAAALVAMVPVSVALWHSARLFDAKGDP